MTTLNFTRIETGRTTRCLIASLSLQVYLVYSLSLDLGLAVTLPLCIHSPSVIRSLPLSLSVSACRVRRCAYQAQLTFRWGVVDPQGRHLCATCLSTFGTATVNKAQLQIRGGVYWSHWSAGTAKCNKNVRDSFEQLKHWAHVALSLLCLRKLQTLRIRSVVPLTVRQPASQSVVQENLRQHRKTFSRKSKSAVVTCSSRCCCSPLLISAQRRVQVPLGYL